MEIDPINDIGKPITDETFIRQGWERHDVDEEDAKFYFWVLPLPKDNPDMKAPCLISCASDDWEYQEIPEGQYTVEIKDMVTLGFCEYEEDIEDLYYLLTKEDLVTDKNSDK